MYIFMTEKGNNIRDCKHTTMYVKRSVCLGRMQRETNKERERERESVCVYLCLCVCVYEGDALLFQP